MTDERYCEIVYAAESGSAMEFDDASPEDLAAIAKAVNMSFRELVQFSGLSQAKFARHFLIPLRSVENWVRGQRKCPLYLKLLIAQDLGIFKR